MSSYSIILDRFLTNRSRENEAKKRRRRIVESALFKSTWFVQLLMPFSKQQTENVMSSSMTEVIFDDSWMHLLMPTCKQIVLQLPNWKKKENRLNHRYTTHGSGQEHSIYVRPQHLCAVACRVHYLLQFTTYMYIYVCGWDYASLRVNSPHATTTISEVALFTTAAWLQFRLPNWKMSKQRLIHHEVVKLLLIIGSIWDVYKRTYTLWAVSRGKEDASGRFRLEIFLHTSHTTRQHAHVHVDLFKMLYSHVKRSVCKKMQIDTQEKPCKHQLPPSTYCTAALSDTRMSQIIDKASRNECSPIHVVG